MKLKKTEIDVNGKYFMFSFFLKAELRLYSENTRSFTSSTQYTNLMSRAL